MKTGELAQILGVCEEQNIGRTRSARAEKWSIEQTTMLNCYLFYMLL